MSIIIDAQSMHARIRQILDREDAAYFTDSQLWHYTSMATDEFIQQHYNVFETSQDARDKLQKLVRSVTVDGINDTTPINVDNLSPKFFRIISLHTTLNNTNVKLIQHADMTAYSNDPFNKADINNPVAYQNNGMINFMGLGTAPISITLVYLYYTVTWKQLDDPCWEEIAQISARRILATLGDPRYQFLQAELMERLIQGGGK